jgi:hypothetical protein
MTTLKDVRDQLIAPFNISDLEIRIGSKSKAKDKATVLVYTSTQAIENRLDDVVGSENWEVDYEISGPGIIARLTILNVTKASTFEVKDGDLGVTKGEASAFKRAASKFGLGRYLWSDSKQVWAELNDSGFAFRDSTESLINRVLSGENTPPPSEHAPARATRPAPASAPAAGKQFSDGVSAGQRKALGVHKVPASLQDVIKFKQAKGTTYGGEGLLDALAEAHDAKGKSWSEKDALAVLATFGIGGTIDSEIDIDEELDDM